MTAALSSFNPILLLISVVGTTIGIALFVIARFGRRVNDHPICHRCGYDLLGLEGPKKCPECGSDLTAPRAIEPGRRETRRGLLLFSIPIILLTGAMLVMSLAPIVRSINWLRLRPTAWLIEDVRPPVEPNEKDRARELARRFALRSLDDAQIDAVIEIALGKQADRSIGWLEAYGDVLEIALLNNRLNDENRVRFLRNAIAPTLMVESREASDTRGHEFEIGFHFGAPRIGTQGALALGARVHDLRINDREPMAIEPNHAAVRLADDGWGSGGATVIAARRSIEQLPPGEYEVRTNWSFEFIRAAESGKMDETLAQWDTTLSATIEIE